MRIIPGLYADRHTDATTTAAVSNNVPVSAAGPSIRRAW